MCFAQSARVMLTTTLLVDVGLVNRAMGTVAAICYHTGGPPNLPIAVMVKFDSYSGPTLPNRTIPITPLHRSWSVTIHKSQGLTLDKVVIDIGKKEFSAGLTLVACSRLRHLSDLLFDPPFPSSQIARLSNSQRIKERKVEDYRLLNMTAFSPEQLTPSILIKH